MNMNASVARAAASVNVATPAYSLGTPYIGCHGPSGRSYGGRNCGRGAAPLRAAEPLPAAEPPPAAEPLPAAEPPPAAEPLPASGAGAVSAGTP